MGSRFRKNFAPSRSVEPCNPQVRQTPRLYEIGAGASEIRRVSIGREYFAETM